MRKDLGFFFIIAVIVIFLLYLIFSTSRTTPELSLERTTPELSLEQARETSKFVDFDGDEITNYYDNCPDISNSDQKDENNNSFGDVCEGLDYLVNRTHLDVIQYYVTGAKLEDVSVVSISNTTWNSGCFEVAYNKPCKNLENVDGYVIVLEVSKDGYTNRYTYTTDKVRTFSQPEIIM